MLDETATTTPAPAKLPAGAPGAGVAAARLVVGSAILLLLALAVCWPALRGGFIWDDPLSIEKNPLVTGKLTPGTVWFGMDFPLTTVAFWLQWLAWGKNPLGYHLVNALLHGANAVLLWRVLKRLGIPGAWWAAAIFTVHPVCIASVAWVSELKNTLSMFFYLLSIGWYLKGSPTTPAIAAEASARANASGPALRPLQVEGADCAPSKRIFYLLSLLAFILALLSKTSTVMLPVVLLGCAWWKQGRVTRRDLVGTAPFFLLALGFGLLTVWFQQHQTMSGLATPPTSFWARLAGAGRAVWFYLGKALWPVNLSMIYPRWPINAAAPTAYLPLLALCAVFGACWPFRHGWGRHVLFALGYFVVSLFPALGFFDMYYQTISAVSDHFQYLALIGPVALVVAQGFGLWPGQQAADLLSPPSPQQCSPTQRLGDTTAGRRLTPLRLGQLLWVVGIGTLSILSFCRAGVLASDERVWRDTLRKNPGAWVAHNNLGCILAEQQQYEAAAQEFKTALAINPENLKAHANLGALAAQQGNAAEAEAHFAAALKIKPTDADTHRLYASLLAGQGRTQEALRHYRESLRVEPSPATRLEYAGLLQQSGQIRQAITEFRQGLAVQSDSVESLNNLAWLLATASEESLRNGAEAVRRAERACQLTQFKQALPVGTLAAAYAEAGRFPEAVATAQKAIDLAAAADNQQFAAINRQLLRLYSAGRPYHEKSRP